jgi:hypothetical protein
VSITAQPTTLPQDLAGALRRAGISRYRTGHVVQLLKPRGQYELLQVLNNGTLDVFLAQWIEDLGEALHTRTADAAHVRDLLTRGTTR